MLELVYNEETKEWEQKKEPFITIEVETEEDFEFIGNAIAFYKKHMDEQAKPQTNADRIRAMSDEELADNWMRDFVVCHRCAYRYECECDEYVTYEKCKEGIVEWLQQPAEEVKDA